MDDYEGLGSWEPTETKPENHEGESSGAPVTWHESKLARSVRTAVAAMAKRVRAARHQ